VGDPEPDAADGVRRRHCRDCARGPVPMVETLWLNRRWLELGASFGYVILIHRYYWPIDTLAGHELNAGCSLSRYLLGYTPHLMHYAQVCRVVDNLPFLAAYFACLLLVLVARVRMGVAEPVTEPR
jgi:hypothetical protein